MRKLYYDVEHWVRRAEQAWLVSEALSDQEARSRMIRIAQTYELLAKHALDRTATHKKNEQATRVDETEG